MIVPGRIVVLGGYGNFGARICRALVRDGRGEIIVAGRSFERARGFAETLSREHPGSRVSAAALDCRDPKLVRQIGAIAPIVVVHAAGPFQGQDYAIAEACLMCRSHYVDLADGRRFVTGFGRLDREARRRDVLLVTGASTLPGVSSAVVDELTRELESVAAIATVIVPAGRTRRGPATLRGTLSYCGKPIEVLEQAVWRTRYGWHDSRVVQFARGARRVAACDVPDLELFPHRYPGVGTVTFHAGPESALQHHGLRLMAAIVRLGLVADWSGLARWIALADRGFSHFGSDVGLMRVSVTGMSHNGTQVVRTWDLTAGRNHGPEIPCAPAIVIAKRLLAGTLGERGAKPCLGLVDLHELAAELADFDIAWRMTESEPTCAHAHSLV